MITLPRPVLDALNARMEAHNRLEGNNHVASVTLWAEGYEYNVVFDDSDDDLIDSWTFDEEGKEIGS